jgi:hypothetical protein
MNAKELHDLRYGENAYCKNCKHAFPVKITLKDEALMCHATPPQPNFFPKFDQHSNIIGVLISDHMVPRPVPKDFFCGLFVLAPDKTDS